MRVILGQSHMQVVVFGDNIEDVDDDAQEEWVTAMLDRQGAEKFDLFSIDLQRVRDDLFKKYCHLLMCAVDMSGDRCADHELFVTCDVPAIVKDRHLNTNCVTLLGNAFSRFKRVFLLGAVPKNWVFGAAHVTIGLEASDMFGDPSIFQNRHVEFGICDFGTTNRMSMHGWLRAAATSVFFNQSITVNLMLLPMLERLSFGSDSAVRGISIFNELRWLGGLKTLEHVWIGRPSRNGQWASNLEERVVGLLTTKSGRTAFRDVSVIAGCPMIVSKQKLVNSLGSFGGALVTTPWNEESRVRKLTVALVPVSSCSILCVDETADPACMEVVNKARSGLKRYAQEVVVTREVNFDF